jgi:hypothetical protein
MDKIDKVDLHEIVYCNITVRFLFNKKMKIHTFENVVWKNIGENLFYKKKLFDPFKLSEPLPILELKIITRMGFANSLNNF